MTTRREKRKGAKKEDRRVLEFWSVNYGDEVRGLGRSWAVARVTLEPRRTLHLSDGLVTRETINESEWVREEFERVSR